MKFLKSSKLRAFHLPASWELRAGTFFLMANLGSGVFNYLFQVVASRQLSAEAFSALNGWFADLALLFMFGGVLQYASNFRPASRSLLRKALTVANVLLLLALWHWNSAPGVLTLDRAVIILLSSAVFGWLMGQVQIRLQFTIISIVNVLMASMKLGMTLMPYGQTAALDRYALALFINFLPALWLISWYLWRAEAPERPLKPASWTAPILLSIATAVMPQFDLVLMNHTQPQTVFSNFAHASLFYKAIYFLIFILAQWLLPRQVREREVSVNSGFPAVAAGGILLSLGLTVVSPWVATLLLHWSNAPERSMVFLSCLHTTLLALVFLRIQGSCARQENKLAGILLLILSAEAGAQMILRLEAAHYLMAVIVIQGALLLGSQRRSLEVAGDVRGKSL